MRPSQGFAPRGLDVPALFYTGRSKSPALVNQKGTYIYDEQDNIVVKKQFLSKFLHDLNLLLNKNGYSINNNKLFRDEVATFIYKLSK